MQHISVLSVNLYSYDRTRGPTPNRLKQMNGDVEKDQFWSYQDQDKHGANAAFIDYDQLSLTWGKKTIRSK